MRDSLFFKVQNDKKEKTEGSGVSGGQSAESKWSTGSSGVLLVTHDSQKLCLSLRILLSTIKA